MLPIPSRLHREHIVKVVGGVVTASCTAGPQQLAYVQHDQVNGHCKTIYRFGSRDQCDNETTDYGYWWVVD